MRLAAPQQGRLDCRMLKADFSKATAALSKADPVMAQLIRQYGPCSLGARRRDAFHVLAASIIGQQLSTKAADTIQKRIHLRVGAKKHLKPAHFLAIAAEELRACGLSNAKAKWLQGISQAVESGVFSFTKLRKMPDADAIAALDALPGIGPWTAEMFLIFALDRPDIFSMGDVGLRNAVNRVYNKGRPFNDARTLKLSARWAPWRSVASWYLWRVIDDSEVQTWA